MEGLARRRRTPRASAALVLLSFLLLFACTSPTVIRETPEAVIGPTPTATPASLAPTPAATPTASTRSFEIERVVFATAVNEDGSPVDERADFPEQPEQMFLCVKVGRVKQGDRFRSYWLEGGQVIGQSDKLALEDSTDPVWIALNYQPIAPLQPRAEHAAELVINDQRIERFSFRVGVGGIRHVIAAAAFATGFNDAGKPVGTQEVFPADAEQLRLLVRISNQVDPTGMMFTTVWYRGDTRIAQLSPDPASDPNATPTAPSRRLSFTLAPGHRLIPATYRVSVLVNGTEADVVRFRVASGGRGRSAPMGRPGTSSSSPTGTQVP